MPEAVYGSHKSGVERNVLGRLLTMTIILQNLNVTGNLKRDLFSTARPEVSAAFNTYLQLIFDFLIFTHTYSALRYKPRGLPALDHLLVDGDQYSHQRTTHRRERGNISTLQSIPRRGSFVCQGDVSPACSRTPTRGVRRRTVDRLSTSEPVRRG